MALRINIHQGFIRSHRDYPNTVEATGNTVGECLNDLVRQLPAIKKEIFDESGELHLDTCVFVNGESAFPEELGKSVRDGDVIDLLPITAGG